MNKGKSKKKMNSYLKMVLIMLAGGVVGGIFGFVTSYTGENSIAAIGHGMTFISPVKKRLPGLFLFI